MTHCMSVYMACNIDGCVLVLFIIFHIVVDGLLVRSTICYQDYLLVDCMDYDLDKILY